MSAALSVGEDEIGDNSALIGFDSVVFSDSKNCSTVGPSDSERDSEPGPANLPAPSTAAQPKPGFDQIFQGTVPAPAATPGSQRRRAGGRGGSEGETGPRTQALTSICILSAHPFFTNFRQCLTTMKQLVEACSRSARWRVGGRAGRAGDTVWAVLTGAATGEMGQAAGSFLLHDVREVEAWVLRLLAAPVPLPGHTRLELEVVDRRYGPLLIFALPDLTRLSLCDFPIHLPLELLGVDLALQVLTLVLLERKVCLHSRDLNSLSLCVLALTQLVYPLQYMFPVIPLLPTSMPGSEQLLLAPTPFLIGLPSSFLKHNKLPAVPEDVWLVDLDAACVTPPSSPAGDQTVPPLPVQEGATLRSQLKQVQLFICNFNHYFSLLCGVRTDSDSKYR